MPNRDRHLIDHHFPLDDELEEALDGNRAVAALVGTGGTGEDAFERDELGYEQLLRGLRADRGYGRARDRRLRDLREPAGLNRLIGSRRTMLWLAVGGVFLALWAALALLVRGASRPLSRQNAKLRARTLRLAESNRLLEQSALEAVESLNATVDAKDPYTAGHSQRVQRIAVALGEELGLDRERLDVAPLRRPVPRHRQDRRPRRDPHEAGPPDGAGVRDREAPSAGRRADRRPAPPAPCRACRPSSTTTSAGTGPATRTALRGDEIPLEAAIVGLADAVDAMTTDRPYSCARTLDEATDEIVRNRGTQFAPAVVDAFVALVGAEPELFGDRSAAPTARSCRADRLGPCRIRPCSRSIAASSRRALPRRSGSSTRRIRSPRTRATSTGLISTLTPDCVYELVQTGHRWEGHDGAPRFYTELLTAFPDIVFNLTDIVIGPQGVCEEANVSATQQAPWLGVAPVEGRWSGRS